MLFLRKALILLSKLVVGIYLFYLFLALILIPISAPWVISGQAAKLLKHPVKVRAIFFNPFLLRLNINGFAILDHEKQLMIGFDKFWADFSFIGLFQKKYRVESLGLNGLKVNVRLQEDNSINLLALTPDNLMDSAGIKNPSVKEVKPMPENIMVDSIIIEEGAISFTDQSVKPNFTTIISGINLNIKNLSTAIDSEAKVSFRAKLDDSGVISADTTIKPFASPLALESVFSLDNYALKVLTPYVGKYTGNTVKDGKFSLIMNYRVKDNQLNAGHRLLVQSFDFGERVESKDALNLPFGLALALLEDSRNRIDIALPVTGDMSKPDFHYFHLIGQVLRNFFFKVITKPFAFLGSIAGAGGESEELGDIRFLPGDANLADTEKEKLDIIVKALKERPRLSLQVNGSYDPVADWKVIKADILAKDFKSLREESKRMENWVYQELYQRRFGIRALWRLTKSYRSKDGSYDQEKIIREIKRQLIDDGSADKVALSALAELRAKVIYDYIITVGLDDKKVSIGEVKVSQINSGYVPLELVLTVFDNSQRESLSPLLPADAKE